MGVSEDERVSLSAASTFLYKPVQPVFSPWDDDRKDRPELAEEGLVDAELFARRYRREHLRVLRERRVRYRSNVDLREQGIMYQRL